MSRRALVSSVLFLAFFVAASAQAVVYDLPSDRELLETTRLIVAGEAIATRAVEGPRGIETLVTFRVDRALKGTSDSVIEIVQPGGMLPSGKWMMIPGAPGLSVGDRALLMLANDSQGRLRVRSLGVGLFLEAASHSGTPVYIRGHEDEQIVRDASRFEAWLEQRGPEAYVVPRQSEVDGIGSTGHGSGYSAAAYVKTFGTNLPVGWPQNPYLVFQHARSASASWGLSVAADAMSQWHSAENSVGMFLGSEMDGGPTFPGPGTSGDDGINSIVFNTTAGELSEVQSEALGYTALYGSGASYVHPHTGETIYEISEADVYLKGDPGSAKRAQLLLHELGHALGFRHSNEGSPASSAAAMNASVSGAYSSPQNWDRDAIQIVYGNGPTCETPSVAIDVESTSIPAQTSTTLYATPSGRSPFTYRWFKEGEFVGITSSSMSTGPLAEGSHNYKVEVKDSCGNTALSSTITITATPCTQISSVQAIPAATTVETNQSTTIASQLNEDATGPFVYRWDRADGNGPLQAIPNSNVSAISTGNLTQTTRFQVSVYNDCSAILSSGIVTITVVPSCVAPAITVHPAPVSIASGQTATLSVTATGSGLSYQWYQGAAGVVTNPMSGATGASFTTPVLTTNRKYWVKVSNSCGSVNSAAATVSIAGPICRAPQITSQPASANVTIGWPATLQVSATSESGSLAYQWYRGSSGDTSNPVAGARSRTLQLDGSVNTRSFWVRVTNSCGAVSSQTATLTAVCGAPPVPTAYAPGDILSGIQYVVSWDAITGASEYQIQEATNPEFTGASSFTTTGNAKTFQHSTSTGVRYWYRVRAIAACNGSAGAFSAPLSVGIVPPPMGGELNPTITVPLGSTGTTSWAYRVWGPPGFENAPFTASVDKPWLRVEPSSGVMTPEGAEVEIFCTLDGMLAGTTTGTLTLEFPAPAGKIASNNGGSKTSVPVSITVVTPITTKPKTTPTAQTVIIPVVGHARGGNNSHFRSDLRVTNTATTALEYLLTFTPSGTDGTKSSKQTSVNIKPGETKAFNDIVKSWFGVGATGDSAIGVLEIRPVAPAGGITPGPGRTLAMAATSRTYNSTPDGTFGQFIPGIAASEFLTPAKTGAKISLQQVSQSAAYRTNLGIVEGSGQPAQVNIRILNAEGELLKTIPLSLAPGEHRQFNQFISENGVAVANGRLEIELVSSTGSVSAYASVVDNVTNDPMLVAPKLITQAQMQKWVIPGVADLTNANASWRTDVRVFNASSSPATVTMTFHPQNASGTPLTRTVNIGGGKVVAMDGVLRSRFGIENAGGAIHLSTSANSNLVATARTYNQRPQGTFGQFIPAVTAADAVGLGERKLELLQIEQSDAFRSHLGLAEMTGNPVVVEISAIAPDQAAAPVMRWPLQANEFTQLTEILKRLNLTTVYNARVTVRVVEGNGRVAAYASVIDNKTQDPTYVPAQ